MEKFYLLTLVQDLFLFFVFPFAHLKFERIFTALKAFFAKFPSFLSLLIVINSTFKTMKSVITPGARI